MFRIDSIRIATISLICLSIFLISCNSSTETTPPVSLVPIQQSPVTPLITSTYPVPTSPSSPATSVRETPNPAQTPIFSLTPTPTTPKYTPSQSPIKTAIPGPTVTQTGTPKPTIQDMVIKIKDLPAGWNLISSISPLPGNMYRPWGDENIISTPIGEIRNTFQSGDSIPKTMISYVIWCNKTEAISYLKRSRELKTSNPVINELSIGDSGFSRINYVTRTELSKITNVQQFDDKIARQAFVNFTKGSFYASISYGSEEGISEKDALLFLQKLAQIVEKNIPVE